MPRADRGRYSPPVPATPTLEPLAPSRSWERAWGDLRDAWRDRELWSHLGWQDIKQRYRRSVLGPLWITLSMAVTALGLGILYSQLFGSDIYAFLPYITTGLIVWGFIIACLTEGTDTFIANEGLMKHLPAPITVYALRTVWRQTIMLGHNMLVYLVVMAIFFHKLNQPYKIIEDGKVWQPGLDWSILLAIPALALFLVNGVWVVLLFGIVSTRFRDVPQVVTALSSLIFFMTPIVWSTDVLTVNFGDAGWRDLISELNPFYHFVQILRAPLIGNEESWHHWAVVGVVTVVGWAVTLIVLRNYRSRVTYWV